MDTASFSAHNRSWITKSPSVVCLNESRDGFTVSTDSGGNGKLTYPVGLLTADEVMFAGGKADTSNLKYYLYSGTVYWLLSPLAFNSNNTAPSDASGFFVYSTGSLGWGGSGNIRGVYGVRPSIALSKGTRYSSGDGSFTNPYVIEEQ